MKRFICIMIVFAMASIASANLISNGEFDEGDAGWGHTSAWGEYFYEENGSTIASIGGWGSGAGNGWSNTSLWQSTGAVFEADTVYQLDVVWKEPGSKIESVMLVIQDVSSGWADIAYDWYDTSLGDSWNTSTLVFDTADNPSVVGNVIGVSFRMTSAAGTWVHIDSVKLVPEPATLGLFGLGSAIAFFRRRK